MKIGVLFDIDDLGQVTYGQAAWAIVMSEFSPDDCAGISFFSGDVDIKGNSRPYTFCIGIDSLFEMKPIEDFKKVLTQSNQKGLLPVQRRFIEGKVCDGLPCDGLIDARGRFLVENYQQWLINVAWRNGWKSFPSLRWLGWFAGAYLIRTQPNYGTPWDDETVAAARQALVEAGPDYTLTTLKEHLDKTNEEGVKSTCQGRIETLKEIWATKEKTVKSSVMSEESSVILICPGTNCGQKLRVPRGRGKLNVICPKCKQSFQFSEATGGDDRQTPVT